MRGILTVFLWQAFWEVFSSLLLILLLLALVAVTVWVLRKGGQTTR